jgi:hypothetical protein
MMTTRQKQKGVSALVEGNTPGLMRGKKEPKLGIRASATSELIFEDCRVPAENLLGKEGEGFKIAMTVLDAGRIGIATQAIGIAEAAYEAARQYAATREAFGHPIGHFQGTGFKIGHEDPHRRSRADLQRDGEGKNPKKMGSLFARSLHGKIVSSETRVCHPSGGADHGGMGWQGTACRTIFP